jgi:hypothetical protein
MKQDAMREIERLESELQRLRSEVEEGRSPAVWPPRDYYLLYHVFAGAILGFFGAAASLLVNVVGSLLVGQHPLEIVRVYLTFPLGESALHLESGVALAVGSCLYLATGAAYGVLFHVFLSRWFAGAPTAKRLIAASVLGIALWLFNYYAVLSWLQPLMFHGDWIVARIPIWVAAITHLVFAWTMVLVERWGIFEQSHHQSLASGREP